MRLIMAACATLCLIGGLLPAGQDKKPDDKNFINKVYTGPEGEGKYVVYVPSSYKADKEFPLILFLHGMGETGADGKLQLKNGLPAMLKKKTDFPFIAVFPQAQKRTWSAESKEGKRAMAILAEVEKAYKVDSKRVYLTGLSMGGFGTWSLAVAYPDKWAAIVPVCGGGNPKLAEKIKGIPCWCFHGDADPAVPVKMSRDMIAALKKAGGNPKYDEYKGVGHNSWERAYATAELYTWLLAQKRK